MVNFNRKKEGSQTEVYQSKVWSKMFSYTLFVDWRRWLPNPKSIGL